MVALSSNLPMKKPNFFIIGAPKCGTTSLVSWLSRHPSIFMSPIKEPHHFNSDDGHCLTPRREDYECLFSGANESQRAVGEASVWYLYSKVAVDAIEHYSGRQARYVVCLRNPVEMAPSLHAEQLVGGNESESSFEEAWRLQEERKGGKNIPINCHAPAHLLYGEVCSLGARVADLLNKVPEERVHFILLDDISSRPCQVLQDLEIFLDVEPALPYVIPKINGSKKIRSQFIHTFIGAGAAFKKRIGLKKGLGVLSWLKRKNVESDARPPLSEKTRGELVSYFYKDIRRLERLIGRDLSAWVED